jgi:hypothetical protein
MVTFQPILLFVFLNVHNRLVNLDKIWLINVFKNAQIIHMAIRQEIVHVFLSARL